LDPLSGEVDEKAGKREAGTVDGRLAYFAIKTNGRPDQF